MNAQYRATGNVRAHGATAAKRFSLRAGAGNQGGPSAEAHGAGSGPGLSLTPLGTAS